LRPAGRLGGGLSLALFLDCCSPNNAPCGERTEKGVPELTPLIPFCPPDRARKPIMMINISIKPQATV
jgi:hypothetical protein